MRNVGIDNFHFGTKIYNTYANNYKDILIYIATCIICLMNKIGML